MSLARPWYLSAANGPKNVIFILDVSGSMREADRIGLMKKVFCDFRPRLRRVLAPLFFAPALHVPLPCMRAFHACSVQVPVSSKWGPRDELGLGIPASRLYMAGGN